MTDNARETPLIDLHRRWGGRIVPFAGWLLPVQYRGITEEHRAVREQAGLFDASHMGELELVGPEAGRVLDELVVSHISTLAVGAARYTCACNDAGGILDDLIIYRRGEERFWVVCNASNRSKIAPLVAQAAAGRCTFRDLSDETCLLALQGPLAVELFSELIDDATIRNLPSFHTAEGPWHGHALFAARTGYTAEDGLELFCPNAIAVELAEALLALGAARGLQPCGLGARDTLRLEGRLSLYGNELSEETTPWEAGIGWVVDLDHGPFRGRDALVAQKERGVTRRIAGFQMVGRGIARHGYPLVHEGQVVGECTSGSPSPTLGVSIGLGYLPVDLTKPGTRIQVDCRGKLIDADVVRTPFYRRPKG